MNLSSRSLKISKNSYKNYARVGVAFQQANNNNWRIWCVSRFHVNKNIKQTYKGGLHITVICCTNKCIINERYISEHQNKLNIYDLQNYEFLQNFFSTEKKIRKIR